VIEGYVRRLYDIEGKVIVITGGGGVLGTAIGAGLARAGGRIVILDVRPEAAQATAAAIVAEGGEAQGVACDVLDKGSLESALASVKQRYGTVDGLINGAGGNRSMATTSPDLSFFDLPQDAFRGVMDLNCMGMWLSSQAFGREMAARGSGAIVNIASISGYRPMTRVPAYNAAKAAVINLTQWLAVYMSQEIGPGIRVNAIAPGFVLTEQNRYLLLDRETGAATPRGHAIVSHTPLGRYGQPDELVGAVLWLLSPASSFVHGATIPIDGGLTAYAGV
jgi:NAD(P)-dependent dehydrogenase (short-subunit alcohol dehydrogenase family)